MDISRLDQCAKSGHNKGDTVNTRDNNAPHGCRTNGTAIEVNRSWSTAPARAGYGGFPQSKTELGARFEVTRRNSERRRGGGGNGGDDGVIGVDGAMINQYILLTQWRNGIGSPLKRVYSIVSSTLFFATFIPRILWTRIIHTYPVRASVSGLMNARYSTECLSARESAKTNAVQRAVMKSRWM